MAFGMSFGGFRGVVLSVKSVGVGNMRVVGGLFVVAGFVVRGSFMVVLGRVLVVFGGFLVVLACFL